jgi:hypothetical protein
MGHAGYLSFIKKTAQDSERPSVTVDALVSGPSRRHADGEYLVRPIRDARIRLRLQPVAATHGWNRAAGVSRFKVFLGCPFNWRATANIALNLCMSPLCPIQRMSAFVPMRHPDGAPSSAVSSSGDAALHLT